MTTATAEAEPGTRSDDYDGPTCWECGGPCAFYKGSVHGWHCAGCIDRYLDAAAARGEAKERKARERLRHKMFHDNDSIAVSGGRRRGGGGPSCVPRRRPGVDSTPGDISHRPLEGAHP